MLKRFLTGIIIVAITIGFFALRFVSPYIFDGFLGVIAIIATIEVSKAFAQNNKKSDLYFILAYPVLAYLAIILCITSKINILFLYAILLGLMIALFGLSLLLNILCKNKMNKEMIAVNYIGTYKKYALKKSVLNLLLMVYPAFVLVQMFAINHLSNFVNFSALVDKNMEFVILATIFVTTMVTDTAAYLVGRSLKGPKLCPKISPNKTISGAIGGVIFAITFSLILFLIFNAVGFNGAFSALNITMWHFIVYGLIASIFSQGGDILASYIKRLNNIKDYGSIFPGHGGLMDRVDGLSINAVITLILCFIIFA